MKQLIKFRFRVKKLQKKNSVRKIRQIPIFYIDRKTKKICIEKIAGEFWLRWLYSHPFGKVALETIVKRKIISDLYGKRMDKPNSKKRIPKFVEKLDIDLSEAQKSLEEFTTFNDFFVRKLKKNARKIDSSSNSVISPADGKITAFQKIDVNERFIIKGYDFAISDFLGNNELAKQFINGSMIIIRLCPTDYHRFHFPISGIPGESFKIKGKYYSVSPISLRKKVETFCNNKREYCIINSENYGNVLMAEIGATLVGAIEQTYEPNKSYQKGDEKGFFKFGGSSILLLFKENSISIDKDLLENTQRKLETCIKMGEKIALYKNNE